VALFGGFLLSGVLTQQGDEGAPAAVASASASPESETTTEATAAPENSVNTDILPGVDLVTEEVEAGVYRVVSDGFRDLARIPRRSGKVPVDTTTSSAIVAGSDGSIWMSMPEGSFRIGGGDTSEGGVARIQTTVAAGPDGAVWTSWTQPVRRFSDGTWEEVAEFEGLGVGGMDVTSDGTVWAQIVSGDGTTRVSRVGSNGLTTIDVPKRYARVYPAVNWGQFFSVSDEGQVWMHSFIDPPRRDGTLTHFDGESWGVADPTGMATSMRTGPFDLGSDGTLWAYFRGTVPPADGERAPGVLTRLRDGSWTTFTAADGVPPMIDMYQGFEGFLRAAPDGSVWMTPQPREEQRSGRWAECDGVARFDGAEWDHFLRGYCVYAFDVAPDGSAWLHGNPELGPRMYEAERTAIETYVITPEAVAATE